MMQLEGLEIQHKMWELNSVLTTLNTKSVCWSQHTITNWKWFFLAKRSVTTFGKKEKCSSTWIFSSRHSVRLTLRKRISPQSRTSGEHSLLSRATHSPQSAPPDTSDSMPIDSRRVLVRILICFWRMFFPSWRFECIGEACVQPNGLSSQPLDLRLPPRTLLGGIAERESPALRTRTRRHMDRIPQSTGKSHLHIHSALTFAQDSVLNK